MALLIPAMAAAMALAAILLYRWLRLLSARRRIKRGTPFIVSSSTAMEEGQALLSPKSAHATAAPASHLASPASPAPRPAAALPAPAPAKAASPRGQKQLVSIARARAMIESFGLPFEPLAELLRSLRCIVAGGSMVHAYMAQPPDQFAGDLDIFCKPEHVKPLRALLKVAGYRPAPRTTATSASACSELASEIGASAPAAAAGYPTSVLDSAVPAAPGSAGAAAAGYEALLNSIVTSEPASATGTGYEALLTSLNAAGATGSAADSDTAAAAAMAPTPVDAAAASSEVPRIRHQLLGRLLRVDDFVHSESGRKVQLVVCRDPQVGCMSGCEAAPSRFDLSAAATVFDGDTLYTLYPATTDKWETFWLHTGDPRGPSRLAKYESRGFKLVTCPAGAGLFQDSLESNDWAIQYHPSDGPAAITG